MYINLLFFWHVINGFDYLMAWLARMEDTKDRRFRYKFSTVCHVTILDTTYTYPSHLGHQGEETTNRRLDEEESSSFQPEEEDNKVVQKYK